jgi:hypothetical protein
MRLTRLAYTQHPRPPQRDLRQKGVFESGGRIIGHVENIYVDDDRTFRFLGVAMRGGYFFSLQKHRLVPVEAIAEEDFVSITLTLDQETLMSAPTLGDPHAAPGEDLQRAAREHCGLVAAPAEP